MFMPAPCRADCQARHDVLSLSVREFVCPSVRPPVHLNLCTGYFENERAESDANYPNKWSTGQGHKRINFGGQEVKGQGHTRRH